MGVDDPLFRGSQWFDCINSEGGAISPYGIAETISVSDQKLGGTTKPANQVKLASQDNPIKVVFTGPTGVPAGKTGICHAESIGYAKYSGSLDTTKTYGVASGSDVLVQDAAGSFHPIGGAFSSGGTSVAMFYRAPKTGGATIMGEITAVTTATGSGPYTGLKIATVTVITAPCGREDLLGESVSVIDHSLCVLDIANEDLIGLNMWATECVAVSKASASEVTPCHWGADDRCCTAGGL